MKLIDILVAEFKGEWPSECIFVVQDGAEDGSNVVFLKERPEFYDDELRVWYYPTHRRIQGEQHELDTPILAEDHDTVIITRDQYMEQFESRSNKFRKMAFETKNANESAIIQRQLFEMGYKWTKDPTDVQFTYAKWLFTTGNGKITWGQLMDPAYEECVYQCHVITKVEFVHSNECIEFNGKFYRKEALERLISQIEPIN